MSMFPNYFLATKTFKCPLQSRRKPPKLSKIHLPLVHRIVGLESDSEKMKYFVILHFIDYFFKKSLELWSIVKGLKGAFALVKAI